MESSQILTETPSCSTCHGHLPTDLGSWMSDSSIKVSDLKVSQERGCRICSLASRAIAAVDPDMVDCNSTFQWVIDVGHILIGRRDWLEIIRKQISTSPWSIVIRGLSEAPAPWGLRESWAEAPPILSPDMASDECFSKIDNWIQECITEHDHPLCRMSAAATLPKRVVDIGFGRQSQICKLHENKGESAPYITLSHCWGSHQSIMTTRANIEQMKSTIVFESLPKTFQDVISIARRLDIQYVWIDSLCIIQKDLLDWELESTKMSDIYANAYLTIAAASAHHDAEGFLERPVEYAGRLLNSDEGSETLDVMAQKLIYHDTNATIRGKPPMLAGPLASRGWAIQENILSRRVLSYCVGEIIFECSCKVVCECHGIDHQVKSQRQGRPAMGPPNRGIKAVYRKPFTVVDSAQDMYNEWRQTIIQYTSRGLTKPSDKLPALSGIASKFVKSTGDVYLAGLWKKDLQAQLLWYRKQADLVTPAALDLPSEYRAPSFSWASVEGPVLYENFLPETSQHQGAIQISVQDAQCTAPGANPFGTVSDGFIMLSGLVLETTLEGTQDGYTFEWSEPFRTIDFYPDALLSEVEIETLSGTNLRTIRRVRTKDTKILRKTAVTCLLIAVNPHRFPLPLDPQNNNFTHFNEYFLVVLGISPSVTAVHERLGLLKLGVQDGIAPRWLDGAERKQVTIV